MALFRKIAQVSEVTSSAQLFDILIKIIVFIVDAFTTYEALWTKIRLL